MDIVSGDAQRFPHNRRSKHTSLNITALVESLGGKAYFGSMNARTRSWTAKAEGLEGVMMNEKGDLCKTWTKGKVSRNHS
jgi:hypothetical protein